ncbi:MAG: hypothetical protein EOR12_21645 [Mesorhizobium sp.]|uniref:hypothetical protein n=1 Tax=Mesorhizobium sp. TaxID=1871066 RepID=UPI000FE790E5|nr:hypothetical protein [Mesorhizobium sp.]RWP86664.1 MAG: hypothetical protein EOR12_21645 [Mesorhizobium sp.]
MPFAHSGSCVVWGIPFEIEHPVFLTDQAITVKIPSTTARWFVFLHTSDIRQLAPGQNGLVSPMRGIGQLGEHAADYVLIYEDGSEERTKIRRRHEVGSFDFRWSEQCTQAVTAIKPRPLSLTVVNEPKAMGHIAGYHYPIEWGPRQKQLIVDESVPWTNFLWAFENPHPQKALEALRFEPVCGTFLISGLSAGNASSMPLRWGKRR